MLAFSRSTVLVVFTCLLLASTMGCSAVRYGGAPEPSFDIDKDLEALSKQFNPDTSLAKYYEGDPSVAKRNAFVSARLVLVNIRYIQFIRKLSADKQAIDSAADVLTLSLNIAGTAFGSATTKTVLAALSAGVAGTKTIIDKDFFFEKSAPALVAQMNSQRAQTLIPILEGIRKPLSDYPIEQAVGDLHTYYMAGTLLGAVQAIQKDAGASEAKANDEIRDLQVMSDASVVKKRALTAAIGAIVEAKKANAKSAYLAILGKAAPDDIGIQALQTELQRAVRGADSESEVDDLHAKFVTAGLIAQ